MQAPRWTLIGLAAVVVSHAPVRADPAGEDAKALLSEGRAFETANEWTKAGAVYARLAANKRYAQLALYREAWAAFQDNDTDAAMTLAARAATLPGPNRDDAKLLYGDALLRRGDLARAKAVYAAMLPMLTGDRRRVVAKKAEIVDRALGVDTPIPVVAVTPTTTPSVTATPIVTPTATSTPSVTPTVTASPPVHPARDDAALHDAQAALDRGDTDAALQLAMKAVKLAGAHRREAQFIYAEALFKRGEYRRARDIYLALRGLTTGAMHEATERRIADCELLIDP